MKEKLIKLITEKSPGAKPLMLVIRGSHAYGTNIETSDVDFSGVFIQSEDDILSNKYIEQINDDNNDTVIYEIRRFLELVEKNNPTVLELLKTPEDCILYKNPIFNIILDNTDKFISKICSKSFGGYAMQQIKKAKGTDKKQNWENDKVTRKDILDFVNVIKDERSIPWKVWNSTNGFEEKFCGLVNIPNTQGNYAVFFDTIAYNTFSEFVPENLRLASRYLLEKGGKSLGFGYKGLVKVGEDDSIESNSLRLSSIPKGEKAICNIFYNKDAYTQHCRDYRSYQEWLENRNTQRYVDVKSHNQKIDGKNMMHCVRLVDMAKEIAEGKGIIVRRPNFEELISIRKGKIDLQTLIEKIENDIIEIDDLFKKSNLPDIVDNKLISELILKVRKNIYMIKNL